MRRPRGRQASSRLEKCCCCKNAKASSIEAHVKLSLESTGALRSRRTLLRNSSLSAQSLNDELPATLSFCRTSRIADHQVHGTFASVSPLARFFSGQQTVSLPTKLELYKRSQPTFTCMEEVTREERNRKDKDLSILVLRYP
eukprot:761851-Hanusia_phi.AAC.5